MMVRLLTQFVLTTLTTITLTPHHQSPPPLSTDKMFDVTGLEIVVLVGAASFLLGK